MPPETFAGLTQLGWQAISTFAACLTLFVGLSAAVVAYVQLRSNRAIRREQTRPYVILDIEPGEAAPNLMDLVVRNIGSTPAEELKIEFDTPPYRAQEQTEWALSDARILNDGIPMLAPGRVIKVFFDNITERYGADAPMSFPASISYKDSRGYRYGERFILDMDIRRGALMTQVNNLHELVRSIEDIRKILKTSAISSEPVHVISESPEEYRERIERRHEETMKMAAKYTQATSEESQQP